MSAIETDLEVAFATAPLATPTYVSLAARLDDAAGISTRRGRNIELDRFVQGTADAELDNRDRALDNEYSAGAWYPNVKSMRRARIVDTHNSIDYPLITGFVDDWPQRYRPPKGAYVPLALTDAFKVLGQIGLPPSLWELEVQRDRPTRWWKLSDRDPTFAALDHGYAVSPAHGRYLGGVEREQTAIVPWDESPCALFDGVSGYVNLPPEAIPTSTEWTIEGWFRCESEAQQRRLVHIQGDPFDATTDLLTVDRDTTHKLLVGIFGPGGGATVFSTGVVDDGEPHHWAIRRYATGFELFVDGVSQGTASITAAVLGRSIARIGGPPPSFGQPIYFLGQLAHVPLWDGTVLDAATIAEHYQAGATALAGETTGERVDRILDFIDWPEDLADIDIGNSQVGAHLLDGSVLAYLQRLHDTEQGHFYVEADGKVTFRQRHALLTEVRSTVSQVTFSDTDDGNLRYADLEFSSPDTEIRNRVTITPEGGTPQTVEDGASITEYGVRTYDRQTLHQHDADALDAANFILGRYKDPPSRVTGIVVDLATVPDADIPDVLARKIGDRVTVIRRPQNIGDPIVAELIIEGIKHQRRTGERLVTFQVSQAETRHYWTLGVDMLGSGTRLGY